jgi:hypothetical protein
VTTGSHRLRRSHRWIAGAWLIGTGVALAVTLRSLATQDYDGLNNLFQWPFGLPWMLLPMFSGSSNVAYAWLSAACGVVNAILIYAWLRSQATLKEQQRLLERARQRHQQ